MKNNINQLLYLKNLYFNAGKIIMEENIKLFKKNINYCEMENKIKIIENSNLNNILFYDSGYIFFDTMCRYLCKTIYRNCKVYCIVSPYHLSDIIISIYIPEKNIIISNSNNYDINNSNNLYNTDYTKNRHINHYLDIANEFFEKSKKL